MKTKLADICEIRVGNILRRIEEKGECGERLKILKQSQLNQENLDLESCDVVEVERGKFQQLVISQRNDIVMMSTLQYNSFLIETDESLAISSLIFRLRANQEKVVPEFLLICLEQAKKNFGFQKMERKGVIRRISAKDLSELEVELPDKKEQERLVELYTIQKRKISKVMELLNKEQELLENIVNVNIKEVKNV